MQSIKTGTPSPSLASSLRLKTSSVHQHLEQALPLTDSSLTLAAYRSIVEAFYGFYVPVENAIARANGTTSLLGLAKLQSLRADLTVLGLNDAEIDALPCCVDLPHVTSVARALGCRYVFEGATLGGQVILRALNAHLGIDARSGAAFFAGYGEETAAMWRSFVVELDASLVSHDEVIAAASETFTTLEAWLRERGALRR